MCMPSQEMLREQYGALRAVRYAWSGKHRIAGIQEPILRTVAADKQSILFRDIIGQEAGVCRTNPAGMYQMHKIYERHNDNLVYKLPAASLAAASPLVFRVKKVLGTLCPAADRIGNDWLLSQKDFEQGPAQGR